MYVCVNIDKIIQFMFDANVYINDKFSLLHANYLINSLCDNFLNKHEIVYYTFKFTGGLNVIGTTYISSDNFCYDI